MLRIENVVPTYILDLDEKEDNSFLKDQVSFTASENGQVILRLYPEGMKIVGKPIALNFDIIDDLFDKKSLFISYSTIKTFDFLPLKNLVIFDIVKKKKGQLIPHKITLNSPQVTQIRGDIRKIVLKDEVEKKEEIILEQSSSDDILVKEESSDTEINPTEILIPESTIIEVDVNPVIETNPVEEPFISIESPISIPYMVSNPSGDNGGEKVGVQRKSLLKTTKVKLPEGDNNPDKEVSILITEDPDEPEEPEAPKEKKNQNLVRLENVQRKGVKQLNLLMKK